MNDTAHVESLYAQILELLEQRRQLAGRSEAGRQLAVAVTQTETARLWAVSALAAPRT